MYSKLSGVLLLIIPFMLVACGGPTLHEDYGQAVTRNKIMQTVDLNASQATHEEVKLDGQKAEQVVENYRKETPKAESTTLTQDLIK